MLRPAPDLRTRRGESEEARSVRYTLMYGLRRACDCENHRVAYAARLAAGTADGWPEPAPALPALDQVGGWSKASGRGLANPDRAMFGGWRIADMRMKRGE